MVSLFFSCAFICQQAIIFNFFGCFVIYMWYSCFGLFSNCYILFFYSEVVVCFLDLYYCWVWYICWLILGFLFSVILFNIYFFSLLSELLQGGILLILKRIRRMPHHLLYVYYRCDSCSHFEMLILIVMCGSVILYSYCILILLFFLLCVNA